MLAFSSGGRVVATRIDCLIVAGWTGRDNAAVQHHIDELAAIGIAPPSTTPLFYRAAASLLTNEDTIQVVGMSSSGEVEPLVVQSDGRRWLGLASDHTDRALEAHSVAASKQACAKPCASALWDFDELAHRLDSLELRSWIDAEDQELLYQEGTLSTLLPLATLLDACPLSESDDAAMLCGTLPAIGGVRPSSTFRMQLLDATTGRAIEHRYRITMLEDVA